MLSKMALADYLPRTSTDAFAMSLTFLLIPVAYLHGLLYVVPSLYPASMEDHWSTYYTHVFVMTYLLLVVIWDLVKTMVTDSSCSGITLPEVAQPGWNHCPYCKTYVPPRAFHCLTCRKCFLRRDHHCFFVGKCVGYHNHRYFTLFVFHIFVTAIYALVLSFLLVFKMSGGFSLIVLISTIFPMLAWLFNMIPVNIVIMVLTSLTVLVVAVSGAMLALTLHHIYNGQTFWEARQNIRRSPGWKKNAEDVLGSRWWIIWLCPFIPSPLPGDGTHYNPRDFVQAPRQHQGQRGQGGRKQC